MTADGADDRIAEQLDETGAASSYGAVLDPMWHRAIVQTDHPADGSPVFMVPAGHDAPAGDVVVLLHGLGNDGSVFGPIMSSLASLGTVVAPTMTVPLLTDVGDERTLMSSKLVDWLTEITPPPWRIVGHSMGGVMTGLILRTQPDLVERAVLLNAPLPGVIERIRVRDTIDRTGRALLFMKALAAVTRFGRPRLPRFLRGTEIAAVRFALRGFVSDAARLDPRVLSRAVLGSRTTDGNEFLRLAERLPAWQAEPFRDVPVTIVLGDRDPLIPAGDVDDVREMYPEATIEVVADCGHFAHLEWSALTVATIASWFDPAA
jgi:pimeloyl-ACP methyl ester carboxylesterase